LQRSWWRFDRIGVVYLMRSCRSDFPIFDRTLDGEQCYLDSAATAHKPRSVIDAVSHFYAAQNASVHRGIYQQAELVTAQFEAVRAKVANFIGARPHEIIFTSGATEGVNFVADAWVLLPDHLHCIWTLPPDDADFPVRWNLIKRKVSIACGKEYKRVEWMTESKKKRRESTLWQRRYWEHQIRNDLDFSRHMDYIHYNPVKHGLCKEAIDWPYSTFHRHVRAGLYSDDSII